jgi:hypothetical protein
VDFLEDAVFLEVDFGVDTDFFEEEVSRAVILESIDSRIDKMLSSF